ncbi:MAG TPA: caspase family protein [Beijerinckiaceae bacterium]|nr:caspase family protein [Beijerinckiaceae bacterium]
MAKHALCIGINDYPGTKSDLSGCVNDANDWAEALSARGYHTTKLLDAKATKAAMVDALMQLVESGTPGDSLVFTYSGHGSWLPDDNGDEPDGRDEMLCPHDISDEQYLMDDELAKMFSRKKKDVLLYFISDSCHSGSVARFAADPLAGRDRMPKIRLLPPLEFVKDEELRERIPLAMRAPTSSSNGEVYPALLISGCKDVEFSYDATFNGRANGAMTRAAIDQLKKNPATPQEWFRGIRRQLPSQQYPQTPQLFGGTKAKRGPML